MNLTFTLDLEDHHPQPNPQPRYPVMTAKILDFLSERNVKGTFFVLGDIAESHPELIKDIHRCGHEIGFHTYAHVPLTRENPERFREQTVRSKALLEDLTGEAVIGFRAPNFSLVPSTQWVVPILTECGFRYSSSVVPIHHPLYGFPNAPRQPFLWNDTLLEIPAPLANIGSIAVPFLGGVYMRYLPDFLVQHLLKTSKSQALWTYCHPYDFDADEKFFTLRETSTLVSLILWFNRRNTFKTLDKILAGQESIPFRDQIARGDFKDAMKFNPNTVPSSSLPRKRESIFSGDQDGSPLSRG